MRKTGYYRVKIYNRWEIAQWVEIYDYSNIFRWFRMGLRNIYDDKDFQEIDENIINEKPEREGK